LFDEATFGKIGYRYVKKTTSLQQVVDLVVPGNSTKCDFAFGGKHADKVEG
jgi:hypothetical protein